MHTFQRQRCGTLYQGSKVIERFLFITDILVTVIALSVADYLRRHVPVGMPIEPVTTFLNPLLYILAALIWTFLLHTFPIYDFRRLTRLRDELKELGFAIATAVFIFAGFLYFSFRDVPRLLILYFLVLDMLFLFMIRLPKMGTRLSHTELGRGTCLLPRHEERVRRRKGLRARAYAPRRTPLTYI